MNGDPTKIEKIQPFSGRRPGFEGLGKKTRVFRAWGRRKGCLRA